MQPSSITQPFLCKQKGGNMKNERQKQSAAFPGEELDERERVWHFGDYAAGACLSLLETFMQHAQIPQKLKPDYEKAASALRQMAQDDEREKQTDLETCVQMLIGLHHFADCLPFMNKDYVEVDDEACAQANRLITQRILPALKDFACRTQFPPDYFCRIYTDIEDQCKHWDTALQEMIFAFEYLANPPKVHKKNDIKRMQTGLHLFAEYLPEMYNL